MATPSATTTTADVFVTATITGSFFLLISVHQFNQVLDGIIASAWRTALWHGIVFTALLAVVAAVIGYEHLRMGMYNLSLQARMARSRPKKHEGSDSDDTMTVALAVAPDTAESSDDDNDNNNEKDTERGVVAAVAVSVQPSAPAASPPKPQVSKQSTRTKKSAQFVSVHDGDGYMS
jgi:hypothetical protein